MRTIWTARFVKKTTAEGAVEVVEDDANDDTEQQFLTLDDIAEGALVA